MPCDGIVSYQNGTNRCWDLGSDTDGSNRRNTTEDGGTASPILMTPVIVLGHLLGLWKDLKIWKILRLHVFLETGSYSSRDNVIFERLSKIFQSFTKIWQRPSLALHYGKSSLWIFGRAYRIVLAENELYLNKCYINKRNVVSAYSNI